MAAKLPCQLITGQDPFNQTTVNGHQFWVTIHGMVQAAVLIGRRAANIYTDSRYRWTPYVQAPNTAHVAWKRQGAIGGHVRRRLRTLGHHQAAAGHTKHNLSRQSLPNCYKSKPRCGRFTNFPAML